MKTQEHTAGPWTIDEEMEGDVMACGELLASAYPMKRDGIHESWKANARLIAAAPQLLEALEKIADNYGGCHCDHSDDNCCECSGEFCPHCISEIAIKSAKGETL